MWRPLVALGCSQTLQLSYYSILLLLSLLLLYCSEALFSFCLRTDVFVFLPSCCRCRLLICFVCCCVFFVIVPRNTTWTASCWLLRSATRPRFVLPGVRRAVGLRWLLPLSFGGCAMLRWPFIVRRVARVGHSAALRVCVCNIRGASLSQALAMALAGNVFIVENQRTACTAYVHARWKRMPACLLDYKRFASISSLA